jgi:hypothetical protein
LGTRATRFALLARIVFLGNQTTVPGQKRIGSHNSGQAQENLPSNGLAPGGQSTTLIVVEARPLAQLLLEASDLLLEVFDYELLAVIHPTRKANEQKAAPEP